MSAYVRLDAHEKPPEALRQFFKSCQKSDLKGNESKQAVIDLRDISAGIHSGSIHSTSIIAADQLRAAFSQFLGHSSDAEPVKDSFTDIPVIELEALPGLLLIPSLFPAEIQLRLLAYLFHRDLSSPVHKTNVHLHHHVTYPECPPASFTQPLNGTPKSFFSEPQDRTFPAKDPTIHKNLSVKDFLNKKLRWITLGGQYDWTNKSYPPEAPPEFPTDIAGLLRTLFPDMEAQAAIVNLYSPGDTLSLHRDVSEQTDHGLVSVSLGCEAVFVVGNDEGHSIKLRSGDALFMTKEARFAWHGVPRILKDTCPAWMKDWPAEHGQDDFEAWRGWMSNKRINLNVRQMYEVTGNNTTRPPELISPSNSR